MSLAKKRKAVLPKNWIVVNSTSLPDRVYYFNVRTGKSSWEEPSLESDQPEPKTSSGQKRKLSIEDGEPEIPTVMSPEPPVSEAGKTSKRKILHVKRSQATERVAETPQMKALRKKLIDRKSKVGNNDKRKTGGGAGSLSTNYKKDISLSADKQTKNGRANLQGRYPKSQAGGDASALGKASSSGKLPTNDSQAGSSVSARRFDSSSTISASRRASRAQDGRGKERFENAKPGVSKNVKLKKNLAKKRLEGLNTKLRAEKSKVELLLSEKLASSNVEDTARPATPTESLPNIYQKCETRFRSLRARLASRSSTSNIESRDETEETEIRAAPKMPRIPKRNRTVEKTGEKLAASNAAENIVTEARTPERIPPLGNNFSDSFFEEMEWEPIGEEKVVVEIQEVRTHLSSDPGATEQKLPDYAINGLQLPSARPNADKQIVYVVVDTNVFLSNLKAITELLEDSPRFKGYIPVVVVPWMVLQELDYIKDNKSRTKSSQLQSSAKTAVDFLFRYFTSKHPRLQGQTAADAASNRIKYQVESPDDEILQSCLQIQESGWTVLLLSNDKNLCNKAIVHNVQTYRSHESIEETLSPRANKIGRSVPVTETRLVASRKFSSGENLTMKVSEKEVEESDDIFGEAKAIIKSLLSMIVSKELENLYGDNWKKYVIVQPPWSVTDVLKCASKHWIAAVGDVFVRQAEPLIKKLSDMFSNAAKYGQSLKKVREMLEVCYDLPQMVKSDEYRKLSEETCREVKYLIDLSERKLKELDNEKTIAVVESEKNSLNDEERANNAFEYFEQIWTFTNNFCGMAADLSGIPHSVTYKSFNPAPPAETINQLQPDLVFRLHKLINALRTVLNEVERLTPSHPALIELYHNLTNYLPNSGEFNDTKILDLIDLLCCINVKKEFLRTGLVQLQELSYQFCRIADFRSTTTTTTTATK